MEDKQLKSYYAVIPAPVRYDEDICPNAKLMYGEISALSNEFGYCFASNKYFGDLYNKSEISISNWVKQLDQKGYIFCHIYHIKGRIGSKKRIIFVLDSLNPEVLKEKFNYFN